MPMSPAGRAVWLIAHIEEHGPVNVTDSDFVLAYIEATDVAHTVMPYGAPRCRTLDRELEALHLQGVLVRERCAVTEVYWGMPRWIYSYDVKKKVQS